MAFALSRGLLAVAVLLAEAQACPDGYPCAACGRCWTDAVQKSSGGCEEPCAGPAPTPAPTPSPKPPAPSPLAPTPPAPTPVPPAPVPTGGLKRLEPINEQVVNAVGQCGTSGHGYYGCEAALGYQDYLGEALRPLAIMAYLGITDNAQAVYDNLGMLQTEMQNKTYLVDGKQAGFQFGIWFAPADGTPRDQEIADGEHDDAIDAMLHAFGDCDNFPVFCKAPIWLRIGYEFNGEWNMYTPRLFIAAWKRIVDKLRANPHTNTHVAAVWDFSSDASSDRLDYMQWYPGDEYVDWWGVNVFSDREGKSGPKNADTLEFLAEAKQRGFPVMLGECSPRGYSIQEGQASVDGWFAPYFDLIANPAYSIKFASYINYDWSTTEWPTWGDAEIQLNDVVGSYYKAEMQHKAADGAAAWLHLQWTERLPSVLNLDGPKVDVILV